MYSSREISSPNSGYRRENDPVKVIAYLTGPSLHVTANDAHRTLIGAPPAGPVRLRVTSLVEGGEEGFSHLSMAAEGEGVDGGGGGGGGGAGGREGLGASCG